MSKKLKTVSICHGIGGLSCNSKNIEIVAVSEYNPFAKKGHEEDVFFSADYAHFKKNGKRLLNLGDVNKIEHSVAKKYKDLDLLLATPPCQPYSTSGKQRGREDDRSQVWNGILSFIDSSRPKAIIVENVKNILFIENGDIIHWYLESLVAKGYKVDFELIDSMDYGSLQSRKRVFITAIRGDLYEKRREGRRNNQKENDQERNSDGPSDPELIKYYQRKKQEYRRTNEDSSFRENYQDKVSGKDKEVDSTKTKGNLREGKDSKIIAFSKSHRDSHIDVRAHINQKCNTLTTGVGFTHQSTGNYILEKGNFFHLSETQGEFVMRWPLGLTRYRFKNKESDEVIENNKDLRSTLIGNGVDGKILDELIRGIDSLGIWKN